MHKNMHCNLNLKYVLPPLANLLFMFLLVWGRESDHADHQILQRQSGSSSSTPYSSIAKLAFVLVLASLSLLCLLTSIKLPLTVTVTADAIQFRAGDFSAAAAIAMLCSIFMPPKHFWIAYSIILALSPCYASLFNLLTHFLCCFYHLLNSLPTVNLNIPCFTQEHPQRLVSPQVEVEIEEGFWLQEEAVAEVEVEIEDGFHLQEEAGAGQSFGVVIDA